MAHKLVVVSHIIRGTRGSPERLADIACIRAHVRRLQKTHPDITFAVPYLLYAETADNLTAVRVTLPGWWQNHPDELWVIGPSLCDGMRAEINQMCKRGLPALFGPEVSLGVRAPNRSKGRLAQRCRAKVHRWALLAAE